MLQLEASRPRLVGLSVSCLSVGPQNKICYELALSSKQGGLAFPPISQKQYFRFCICLVCLFVFAGDSCQGFSDKYVQQLAITLEILSI